MSDPGQAAPAGVLLVDDQPLVRTALRMVITDAPDLDVVGEAGTGTEAVEAAGRLTPDVVVMDIRMPGMDGIEATRRITAGEDGTRVIVLSTFDDDECVYGALRAGASGFLVKDMALDDILDAIRTVAAGDALLAPSVTRRLIAEFASRPAPEPAPAPGPARAPASPPEPTARPASQAALRSAAPGSGPPAAGAVRRGLDGITEREREVLTLVGRGLSNHEIAAELVLSVATVKTYVTRLLTKLDARDRVQLVIIAYETGLVAPP